ncbi:hypothetical protein BDV25DRAFT_140664 [Aspergillus avenaceus]|uniref:Rhodopsin domain-containing protein n=1 Tax=Aspergillus avenaceus TaxID=36643 RepID=A0A5N6TT67_ASPAV|nr:hypothetical protein BDV25DRAFT_140664 [Aspergillus avenaceus]
MSSSTAPQGMAAHVSATKLIAITWTGVALGLVFTTMRVVIRVRRAHGILVDDYFVIVGLILLITNAVLQTIQTPHIYSMLFGENIVHHTVLYTRYEFIIIGLFWSVLWSIKGSFLALFWSITAGLPGYRRACLATGLFAFLSYGGCWFASAFTCHPATDYFKFGKCTKPIDRKGSIISISYSTAVDILTDLIIMYIPLHLLHRAKITLRQKISLGFIFSIGCFIIATAIVRAVQITDKAYTDPVGLAVWGVVESSVSVIVGCLPPLKTWVSRSEREYVSRSQGATRIQSLAGSEEPPLPLEDMKLSIDESGRVRMTGSQNRVILNERSSRLVTSD